MRVRQQGDTCPRGPLCTLPAPPVPCAPWPTLPEAFLHSFVAGDVVLILPENPASHTQQFCQVLGLDPDQTFTLLPQEPGERGAPWGPSCGHVLSLPCWGLLSPPPALPLQVCPARHGCPSPAP